MNTQSSFDSINRIPLPSQMEVEFDEIISFIYYEFRIFSDHQVCLLVFQVHHGNHLVLLVIITTVQKQHDCEEENKKSFRTVFQFISSDSCFEKRKRK
jgi:hypothetical protein